MLVGALIIYWIVTMFYKLYIGSEKRYMMEKKFRQQDNDGRYERFLAQNDKLLQSHNNALLSTLAANGVIDKRAARATRFMEEEEQEIERKKQECTENKAKIIERPTTEPNSENTE
jgi:hypothetical protein